MLTMHSVSSEDELPSATAGAKSKVNTQLIF